MVNHAGPNPPALQTLTGMLLLVSGWAIVVAALMLLGGAARIGFLAAGLGVELLGMALVIRGHGRPKRSRHE